MLVFTYVICERSLGKVYHILYEEGLVNPAGGSTTLPCVPDASPDPAAFLTLTPVWSWQTTLPDWTIKWPSSSSRPIRD